MKHVVPLLARELGAYFLGPIAYIMLLAFQVIACFNFSKLVAGLSQRQIEFSSLRDPMSAYISWSPFFWIPVMIAIPALTMRLLAEERRSGTIETLLTLPVTEMEVVLAKWLAGVVMYGLLLLPFGLYLPFLYYQAKFYFDLGPMLALGIGLTTMGMMFVAIGLLFQRVDTQPDHRRDLDLRHLVLDGCDGSGALCVRRGPACGLGRRRSILVGLFPDPRFRVGPV